MVVGRSKRRVTFRTRNTRGRWHGEDSTAREFPLRGDEIRQNRPLVGQRHGATRCRVRVRHLSGAPGAVADASLGEPCAKNSRFLTHSGLRESRKVDNDRIQSSASWFRRSGSATSSLSHGPAPWRRKRRHEDVDEIRGSERRCIHDGPVSMADVLDGGQAWLLALIDCVGYARCGSLWARQAYIHCT